MLRRLSQQLLSDSVRCAAYESLAARGGAIWQQQQRQSQQHAPVAAAAQPMPSSLTAAVRALSRGFHSGAALRHGGGDEEESGET